MFYKHWNLSEFAVTNGQNLINSLVFICKDCTIYTDLQQRNGLNSCVIYTKKLGSGSNHWIHLVYSFFFHKVSFHQRVNFLNSSVHKTNQSEWSSILKAIPFLKFWLGGLTSQKTHEIFPWKILIKLPPEFDLLHSMVCGVPCHLKPGGGTGVGCSTVNTWSMFNILRISPSLKKEIVWKTWQIEKGWEQNEVMGWDMMNFDCWCWVVATLDRWFEL